MTTLKDIADKAKVSVSTVSRVLNNKSKKYRIGEETQKLVRQIALELNYRPNRVARGLRLKRTLTIGLVVPDISNPFFAYITRVIQRNAADYGYSMIVCNTDENIDIEIEQIELLQSKGMDGIILLPVGTRNNHIKSMLDQKMPLVLLDRCFDDLDTNSVTVDNFKGAYQAIEHLIQNGHTRIAVIQGLPNTYTNNARVHGYKEALQKYNIPVDSNLIVGKDFGAENGYIESKLLLNLQNPPTAIFTTSDLITLGALKAIKEEKLSVPDDISIVAFDEIDFAPFLLAPMTTIEQPKEMMGQFAVKMLIEEIKSKGEKTKQRIDLEPKIVIRNSVLDIKEKKVELQVTG